MKPQALPRCALVFSALLACALNAQSADWTLSRVLQEAATQHPSVRLRQSESRAAEYELDGARWARYPTLGTELLTTRGGTQAVARLQQPVWTGGRIEGQIGLATANLSASTAAVDEARQAIMLEAATAFLESLRLQARLDAALANEAEHQRLGQIIERRVRAEVSPVTDATQARARLQQAIAERMQFERQLLSLRANLEQIIGQPVLHLRAPASIRIDMWNEATLLEAALQHSPERKRLTAQIDAGQAQIGVARSVLMPQVTVGYEHKLGALANGEDRGRLFLGVNLQPGAGLSSLAGIEVAAARQQAARDSLEQHRRQLEQAIRSGWSEAHALALQLEPSRALLNASDEVVESYLRQFQVGRKTWLDVLNAQREKTNARYTLADIEAPLLLARLRLLLLAGAVRPDALNAIVHD